MTNKASSSATSALTARITGAEVPVVEQSSLAINLGEAIEPLRMGGVTFYGESARVIRDAQAVLQAAGAGQLEVVKRANEPGEPFVVIADQVFINDAAVEKASVTPFAIDHSKCSVKLAPDGEGRYYVAGFGVGIQPEKPKVIIAQDLLDEIQRQISSSKLGTDLQEQVRQIIRDELKPGDTLHRS